MGEENLFGLSLYDFLKKRKKSPLFSQKSSQLTGNDLYSPISQTVSQSLIDEADAFNSQFENPNITLGEFKYPEVKRLEGGIGNIERNNIFGAPTKLEDVQNNLNPESVTLPTDQKSPTISSGVMKGIGMTADFLGGFIQKSEYSGDYGNTTKTFDSIYDQISSAIMAVPGWGTMVGGIMKGGALLGKGLNKIGGGTDGMTKTDALLGSSFLNLTPVGMINGFGGKRAKSFEKSREAYELLGGDYQGTEHLADNALSKSNKKYGLFSSNSRHKANSLINKAKNQQSILNSIYDDTKDMFDIREGMYSINALNRRFNLQGGYDQNSVRVAKKGAKLEPVISEEDVEFIISEESVDFIIQEKVPEFEEIIEFKKGGSFNLIPEGALHARLHHMDIDGITKKGIPVISEEDGVIEQHAEIEHSEIIYRLEVTEKLEKLMRQYEETNDDKYAIEAGKLLVEETLYNTDDKTNLINEVNT